MIEIDRISSLPDELLSEIVSRLSVKEAATTCVLSRRWRHVFALITLLEFDHSCPSTLEKYKRFVDNALRACRSERITMFSLKIGKTWNRFVKNHEPVESRRFNFWMSFALSRGVKELDFVAYTRKVDKLPLALFECQTLEVLTLVVNHNLQLPSSFSLPNLKVLRLELASFLDGDFITRLVSRSPLLECLALTGFRDYFEPTDVISAPFLSRLVIRLIIINNRRHKNLQGNKFILDAPNLKYLDYSLELESQYSIGDLNSLVEAQLDMPLTEVRLFRSLSNVQYLHLGTRCMEELNHFWNNVEVLQELDYWPTSETIPSCLESHLKRIVINQFRPSWNDLELALVKYFLIYALVLEELVIIYMNLFTLAERILLERELQKLPKGSSTCSIKMQWSL